MNHIDHIGEIICISKMYYNLETCWENKNIIVNKRFLMNRSHRKMSTILLISAY